MRTGIPQPNGTQGLRPGVPLGLPATGRRIPELLAGVMLLTAVCLAGAAAAPPPTSLDQRQIHGLAYPQGELPAAVEARLAESEAARAATQAEAEAAQSVQAAADKSDTRPPQAAAEAGPPVAEPTSSRSPLPMALDVDAIRSLTRMPR